jgi:hypothetical protein
MGFSSEIIEVMDGSQEPQRRNLDMFRHLRHRAFATPRAAHASFT